MMMADLGSTGTQMSDSDHLTLEFRCPKELEGLLPPPVPATMGLPDWLKAMPSTAFSALNQADEQTVKRCPPFVVGKNRWRSPLASQGHPQLPSFNLG